MGALEKAIRERFQSLKGLILTASTRKEFESYKAFQSLKGLILTIFGKTEKR